MASSGRKIPAAGGKKKKSRPQDNRPVLPKDPPEAEPPVGPPEAKAPRRGPRRESPPQEPSESSPPQAIWGKGPQMTLPEGSLGRAKKFCAEFSFWG